MGDLHIEIRMQFESLDALRGVLDLLAQNPIPLLEEGTGPLSGIGQVFIPIRDEADQEGSYPDPATLSGDSAGAENASLAPAPKKRTRKPKAAEPVGPQLPVEPVELPPDTSLMDTNPGPGSDAKPVDPLGLDDLMTVPAEAAVHDDLTNAADKRAKGRQMLLDLIARQPSRQAECRALLAKYGVKTFAEVSDERAGEFLADAYLVVNSEPGVA